MDKQKDRISKRYVALRTVGEPPPTAVETIHDAGSVFAIVPLTSVDPVQLGKAMPVLTIQGTDELEVATGAIVLRWSASASEIDALLGAAGVKLIRNYGAGGIVFPKAPEEPFDLVDRLSRLDFISSAKVHTISRAEKR